MREKKTTRNDLLPAMWWGVLLALILGSIAAWPFLTYPGLPRANDAELHVLRTAELGFSVRAGNLYPRWAPDFYHGYGYPIFNYYAPLTYHLGNGLALFRPELAAQGAKTLFVLTHLLGAVGAFLLGRDFGETGGGLLAAAAFAFSPYHFLINPHLRGDLPEFFALALVPWALWSWERLWRRGDRSALVGAVLVPSGVLLSHNLTGLTTMLLLWGFSLWQWGVMRRTRHFWRALLAGVLIVALTAFFWLPFLLERQHIQLDVAGEGHYDFHNHFVTLRELVAPLRPMDWRATTLQVPMSVGLSCLIFALAGFGARLLCRDFAMLRRIGFYALGAGFCFWLCTSSSVTFWEWVPGMAFYQFPWRFLGPLTALLVPLIASLGQIRVVRHASPLMTGLLCLLLVAALPGLYVLPWESGFGDRITPQDLLLYELEGRWRGTTSTNDFVPTTVEMIPGPQPSVLASYADPPVDRVNRHTLPEGTTVDVLPSAPWQNRFAIVAPQSFILRLYLFQFPGWRATLDGDPIPIDIAHPEGFITVKIPEGNHEVNVDFKSTPARKIGWVVTGVGALGLLFAVRHLTRLSAAESLNPTGPVESTGPVNYTWLRWATAGLLAFVIFNIAVVQPFGWFRYTSAMGTSQAAQHQQRAALGDEILLLGYDIAQPRIRAGKTLEVTLYWQAQRPLSETYQSFVHLVYPEGRIWTQSDHLNPGGFPTDLWPVDRYVRDTHKLFLPPDLPPGEYQLSVGIYALHQDRRLPVSWAEAGQRPDAIVLNSVLTVRR